MKYELRIQTENLELLDEIVELIRLYTETDDEPLGLTLDDYLYGEDELN
jgi:hypothetical protein